MKLSAIAQEVKRKRVSASGKEKETVARYEEKGQIHGNQSCMLVGRGSDLVVLS